MEKLPEFVIHETNQYIVVNKPAGIIVEKNPFELSLEDQVYQYLAKSTKKPFIGVVHRLDRVTSGVIVFAKKKSTLKLLNKQFEDRQIQKKYYALTANSPQQQQAVLEHYLSINKKEKIAKIEASPAANAKIGRLHYRYLKNVKQQFLWEIRPETGRYHQIRAQLAHIGCPIIGDKKYGSTIHASTKKIALHAGVLQFFDTQSNEKVRIKAPFPNDALWTDFF